MRKWIFFLALTLCCSFHFTQHQCQHEHFHAEEFEVFEADDKDYLDPSSISNEYLHVRPMDVEGFSGEGLKKLEKAFELVEKIVNSQEFKNRIINFKNSKGQRAFASNKGLSNEEIYAIFMEGRETLQSDTPDEMNFFLKLYHRRFSKVIGWTNPQINTINVNWKFFKKFKPSDVAGNLVHEWTHKIGFDHRSAAEHDSAPYAIGYIVREMGERYLEGEELY